MGKKKGARKIPLERTISARKNLEPRVIRLRMYLSIGGGRGTDEVLSTFGEQKTIASGLGKKEGLLGAELGIAGTLRGPVKGKLKGGFFHLANLRRTNRLHTALGGIRANEPGSDRRVGKKSSGKNLPCSYVG